MTPKELTLAFESTPTARARRAGLRPATVLRRMREGQTLEQALRPQPTIAAQARARGIEPGVVYVRMGAGMSLEQALAKPVGAKPAASSTRRAKLAARAAGYNKYEGRPCKYGHVVRYISSDCCIECASIRAERRRSK